MEICEIERGIEKPRKRWKKPHYPFPDMEVGDSFARPVSFWDEDKAVQGRITSAAWQFRHRGYLNRKYSTMLLTDEEGQRFVRCWRDE